MSKRAEHRFNLQDYKASKEEEGAVYIDAGERTFRVPPPLLWPDKTHKAAISGDGETFGLGTLGEEDYAAWTEAGGTGQLLLSMVNDVHGADPGESSDSSDSSGNTAAPSSPTSSASTTST